MTNSRMTNDEGMTKPEIAGDAEERFWMDGETPVIHEEPDEKRVYDLEEPTARRSYRNLCATCN